MKRISFVLSVLAIGALSTPAADSATITWEFSEIVNTGSSQNTTGTGFLATTGTLVYAENTGGVAASLDGIDFVAGTLLFGGSQVYGGFHGNVTAAPITSSGAYGNAGAAENVTLGTGGVGGDLTIGQPYRVQAIVMDGRGSQAARTFEVDGLATDHALGTSGVTWGNALLATGTFVADGPSQIFTVEVINSNGTSASGQLNGLVLQAVPEPSTGILFGIGCLMFAVRRRK